MAMRLLDLFSGIGGFSYAAEKLIGGYETVAFCEMDEFCQKVLKKHWPQVPIFDDVRTLDAARLGRIDIVTGGYPCQPFSQAGRRQGEEDERHLWPEMLRIIKSCQPRYVLAENVAGHVTMGLDQVLTDLEDQGYTTRAIIVPACAKNAPHRRDRVWIIGQYVGYTEHNGSSATKIRGSDIEDAEWPQKRSQQTFQFERASKPRHYETMANTENDRGQQTEWQRGESVRGRSNDFSRSETEGEEADRTNVADTKCLGWEKRAEKSEEFDREKSSDQSDNGSQGCTISNTDKDVANTESKGLQGRQFSSTISNKGNEDSNIRTRDSKGSSSWSVEQRVGNMADGISRGLLRHFDREPDHIPRVTKGEKDRAKKLKALGNSIVPQVAAEILLAIRVSEESD